MANIKLRKEYFLTTNLISFIFLIPKIIFYKLMVPFFNRIELERIGVIGPEIGLLLGWSAGSGCGTPLQRQERRWVGEGFARDRSDA